MILKQIIGSHCYSGPFPCLIDTICLRRHVKLVSFKWHLGCKSVEVEIAAKFLVHENHLWSRLHDGWHYRCCKREHNLYFVYIPYSYWAVPLLKLTNKNVCLIVVFCKVCWVLNKRGQWVRKRQQERGRCGRVEVRDPETDETRGSEREQKRSWSEGGDKDIPWCTAWVDWRQEERAVERGRQEEREEGRSARSEHVSVWVASLIRRCCQGPQRRDCRDPTSPPPFLPFHWPLRSGRENDWWVIPR